MKAARVWFRDAPHAAVQEGGEFRLVPDAGLEPVQLVAQGGWGELAKRASMTVSLSELRLLAPIGRPGKIIGIGLNYWDHTSEQSIDPPENPILFAKMPTAVIGPDDPIPIYPFATELDYEAELAVVLGRTVRDLSVEDAYATVAGYTIVNDVSARDLQRKEGQWVRAKSLDGYAPMGPFLVSPDEVGDPGALEIRCYVNGEQRQNSNTRNLIFDIPTLISFCSQGMTLEPGDVISTGTPGGVGAFMSPATFLKAGDTVRISVERLGELVNPIGVSWARKSLLPSRL